MDTTVEEFYETESAKRVLDATSDIVAGTGHSHRFRYIHATFGSGKSHLLKLIGIATGEMEGLSGLEAKLANQHDGFGAFHRRLEESDIDRLHPLLMNLLDRDREDTELPLLLFEELGRRRGYQISPRWLLELCWQLEVKHGLWEQIEAVSHKGYTLAEIVERPSSLRTWLYQVLPELDGATDAGLSSKRAVERHIDDAQAAVDDSFDKHDLVKRLVETKQYLRRDGKTHEFLIGLDEVAIYVGDQQRRYDEFVGTVTALIEGLNPPIIGTGQWSIRDMQRKFYGEVDESAWYTAEVPLRGADTEIIVRKRWLQKSDDGQRYIQGELLAEAPDLEPKLTEDVDLTPVNNPVEAYPFRDRDLWLLRSAMQGLIEGDRETEREYIQGRALLARVRSLFADHGWVEYSPEAVVSWDVLYDVIEADTSLIPDWARDLIDTVERTLDDVLAVRTAKALYLLSQVEGVPRTAENLTRLLADSVTVDIERLHADIEERLDMLSGENLIREETDESPTTYTILSEAEIAFWRQVQEEAAEIPLHQLRSNLLQYLRDVDQRLTADDGVETSDFDDAETVTYTVRYSIRRSVPASSSERYGAIVIRLLAARPDSLQDERVRWQEYNSGPRGTEDLLIVMPVSQTLSERVRQIIAMKSVVDGMTNPRPELQLQRQTDETDLENSIQAELRNAAVYTPNRENKFGTYLEEFDEAVARAVDSKFPDRMSLDSTLQAVEDIKTLSDFFKGNADWPFTDTDAERFGVDTLKQELTEDSDGWAIEFLSLFEGDDLIDGDQILETIEGRRGAFLGSSEEALHALLIILAAANRIEIRIGGERVTDLEEIARTVIRRTRLMDAVIGLDPDPPPTDELRRIYTALLGSEPSTDDTSTLLDDLSTWTFSNSATIRTVATQTNLRFGSGITLENLKSALEPAMTGGELDPGLLTNSTVVEEAERYSRATPLFETPSGGGESVSLWERFKSQLDIVDALYPADRQVKQMHRSADGSSVPSASTLEEHLETATDLRIEKLEELYHRLAGKEPSGRENGDIGRLCRELTTLLIADDLATKLEDIEERFEALSFEALREIIGRAHELDDDPLTEELLARQSVRDEALTLEQAQALVANREDGTTLRSELVEVHQKLQGAYPDSVITQWIHDAITGRNIPSATRAETLLGQARTLLEDGDEDDESEDLWNQVLDHEDGTIILIEKTEVNR